MNYRVSFEYYTNTQSFLTRYSFPVVGGCNIFPLQVSLGEEKREVYVVHYVDTIQDVIRKCPIRRVSEDVFKKMDEYCYPMSLFRQLKVGDVDVGDGTSAPTIKFNKLIAFEDEYRKEHGDYESRDMKIHVSEIASFFQNEGEREPYSFRSSWSSGGFSYQFEHLPYELFEKDEAARVIGTFSLAKDEIGQKISFQITVSKKELDAFYFSGFCDLDIDNPFVLFHWDYLMYVDSEKSQSFFAALSKIHSTPTLTDLAKLYADAVALTKSRDAQFQEERKTQS